MSSCLVCRHARKTGKVSSGFAVCVFDASVVQTSHVCHSFESLRENGYTSPSKTLGYYGAHRFGADLPHHIQVNSGVECQFGTNLSEIQLGSDLIILGVESQFETKTR